MVELASHKTRGSAAGRELYCAGAIGYDGPRIDENTDAAKLGTAADVAMGRYVTGNEVDLEKIAKAYGVDEEQLSMAFAGGCTIWRAIEPMVGPEILTQVRLEGDVTEGTSDLLSFEWTEPMGAHNRPASALVLDWKLGFSDDEHPEQLKAYTAALTDSHGWPVSDIVTAIEAHLVPAEYIVHEFTPDDIDAFKHRLRRQHADAGKQFAPGKACKYCPRDHDCEPREQYIRAAARMLAELHDTATPTIDMLALAYHPSRDLSRAIARYDRILKQALESQPIDLPDGGRLEYVRATQEKLAAGAVLDYCRSAELDVNIALSSSKAALNRAVKAVAARGSAARLQRAAIDAIREAGGVEVVEQKRVKVVS